MNKSSKILCFIVTVIIAISAICPSAFAREFAPAIDASNIGVQTQYKYSENDPSWLRKLVIKEDMLTSEAFYTEEVLYPVTDYPYTSDAPHFKSQVDEYLEIYTLDENSQRAAYLYMLELVGALNVIANPETSDKSKADWLREKGIIITEEDEKDQDKVLMISALYAMMKNDLYYVYTGEHLTIPEGTPLEEAVVMYLMALSGEGSKLSQFILKYFGTASVSNLDDYIYYTSLMALYTQGYVSPFEIPTISREEVYRRVAIMTINGYGIAIDSETATTEEIQHKYLTAMLGTQYRVTLDPTALKKAINKDIVPYYILQRMAYEDANVTISQTKHTYEECFKIVLQKTQRFDLEDDFYSDIYEYDVRLGSIRSTISINPTPISNTGTSIFINGKEVNGNSYALVELSGAAKETVTIVSRQTTGDVIRSSTYKINVYQGTTPAPNSDLTGLIPSLGIGTDSDNTNQNNSGSLTGPGLNEILSNVNGVATPLLNNVLTLNDKGQLVDQYGNVVSDSTYETLPEGYKYVLNDDGIVTVILTEQKTTEPTTSETDETADRNNVRNIVIAVSLFCFIALLIAIIVVLKLTKSKRNMTDSEKTKARRTKEKRKKEKRENKEMRKNR